MSRNLLILLLVAAGALAPSTGWARWQESPPSVAESASATTTLRQADARVAGVAYRLALRGLALCPRSYPLTGLLFHHLAEYEPADRRLMIDRYGLDRGPGVLTVLGDTPAARAGLVAGDVLLSVNGVPFPSEAAIAAEPDRKKWRPMAEASELQLENALRGGPAQLDVLREGRRLSLVLDSVPGCLGRVRLARSDQVNAFATGRTVVMTTAMLHFLRTDDELAVVLGHELAHDILGHEAMRTEDGLLTVIGVKPSGVWRREEAADRMGVRLMAAAGYDLSAVIPFWRRYLGKYDWFPQIFRNHPSLRAREKIARQEIDAVRRDAAASR